MATQESIEKAAQAWCKPTTSHLAMVPELALAFAEILDAKDKTFGGVVRPVIEWLAKNRHPHTSVIIDATHAELVEGVECISTDEFLVDRIECKKESDG